MSDGKLGYRLLLEAPVGSQAAEDGVHIENGPSSTEAERARWAKAAWHWPEAADTLARARASVIVSAPAGSSAAQRALRVTQAAAALARRLHALAAIFEPSEVPCSIAQLTEQTADASLDDPPIFLWIAFDGSKNPDGSLRMLTRGLTAFGSREVEVEASRLDGEALLERVADVALFLVTSGEALEDGDQVEITSGKVRVRVMPSLRGDGAATYRLRT